MAWFPLPFGCRHSLLGSSCPAGEVPPSSQSAYQYPSLDLDPDEVSTFHMRQIRPGRVPPIPRGGGVHTTGQVPPVDACRFSAASPAPRYCQPSPGLTLTRSHQRFTRVHPSGLPLTCNPRMARESLGSTLSFAPRRYQRRTSRRGRALEHTPGATSSTTPPTSNDEPLNTCDLVSHHLESASRFDDHGPSTSPESLTEQALSLIYTPTTPFDLEAPGLTSLSTNQHA